MTTNSLEISGTVKNVFPLVTGNGKNGQWQKRDLLIETPGQYPKSVVVTLWGDKANLTHNVGDKVTASIEIESREYNSKYYTDVKAWKIAKTSGEQEEFAGVDADDSSNLPF